MALVTSRRKPGPRERVGGVLLSPHQTLQGCQTFESLPVPCQPGVGG